MEIIIKLVIGIMETKYPIFGFNISFMDCLVFTIVATILLNFIYRLFD